MPSYQGVTVRVINGRGQMLEEFGVRRMQLSKTCSCYIQSETGMTFKVQLTPQIPFTAHKEAPRASYAPRFADDSAGKENYDEMMVDSALSSPERPVSQLFPPFHLLVTVFLDGREKPERRTILYLNPRDPGFKQPSGTVSMRSRWVKCADGSTVSRPWMFNEVGVDTALDALKIQGEPDEEYPQNAEMEDEQFLAAMKSARLTETDEQSQQGMITIVLRRVRVQSTWDDENFEVKHADDEDENMKLDSSHSLSHTVGLAEGNRHGRGTVRVCSYSPFVEGEAPHAILKFFYRSEAILRKFGFKPVPEQSGGESSKAIGNRKWTAKDLTERLSALTPLNKSYPLSRYSNKSAEDGSAERRREGESASPLPKRPSTPTPAANCTWKVWRDSTKVSGSPSRRKSAMKRIIGYDSDEDTAESSDVLGSSPAGADVSTKIYTSPLQTPPHFALKAKRQGGTASKKSDNPFAAWAGETSWTDNCTDYSRLPTIPEKGRLVPRSPFVESEADDEDSDTEGLDDTDSPEIKPDNLSSFDETDMSSTKQAEDEYLLRYMDHMVIGKRSRDAAEAQGQVATDPERTVIKFRRSDKSESGKIAVETAISNEADRASHKNDTAE